VTTKTSNNPGALLNKNDWSFFNQNTKNKQRNGLKSLKIPPVDFL
jgi:hypothetical protein